MNRGLREAASIVVLGVVFGNSAYAEQINQFSIEEIKVTAQKRTESLQDIPLAVTAISALQLQEDGISDFQNISNRTPGLSFGALSIGQPEIAIRGIGTKEDGASASDSTVVSVDDVYIASRTAQVFDIFDLERVEILRGPQGTLYGKNAIGGSINFVTEQPTEETRIRFRQTVGNYGQFDTGAMLSGKIAENLFGKVAVSRRKNDGYHRNVLAGSPHFGQRQGEINSFSYRGTLRWTPNDSLELIFTADGANDNNGGENHEPVGSAGPLHDCVDCISNPVAVNEALGGAGPHNSLADTEGHTKRDVEGYSLKINWDQDWGTLVSISSYRKSDFDWLADGEGLPPSSVFVALNVNPGAFATGPASLGFAFDVNDAAIQHDKQLTQELRLMSSGSSAFNYVVGLFYSHEEANRTEEYFFPSIGLQINGENFPSDMASFQTNRSNSYAAYADGSYDVTDTVTLRAGIRYSYEKKKMTAAAKVKSGVGLLLKDFDTVGDSHGWGNVSWRAVADWKFTNEAMAYASVSTGFKSGGYTGSASTAEQATKPFKPEKATNFEVGLKSQVFENRLRLNLAAFYTDYKDLQVTRFFQPEDTGFGQFITENAGKAEIKGVEVEFTALVTQGLEFGGSYAYLDAKFKKFTGTPGVTGDTDFAGNFLRQAPEHSVALYGKYTYALKNGSSLSAKVNYRYQSLSYYDPDNNPLTTIPAYELWDARLAWLSEDGRWEIAGWVENIGDKDYRTHAFSQRDGRIAFAMFGKPRTYGLTTTFNY